MRKLLIAAAGALFASPAFAAYTIAIGMAASKTGLLNVDSILTLHDAQF